VDIEVTPYSVGPIVCCDPEILIRSIKYGGIDNHIVKKYIQGVMHACTMTEFSGAAATAKGKESEELISSGIDRHLSSLQYVAINNLGLGKDFPISDLNFGFNKDIIYGSRTPIPRELGTHFGTLYERFRKQKGGKIGYERF